MVKKIEDFKEPILVERFLRKISGNSPFEVTGETRNAKNDDKYWEYTADENSDSNHMNDNGSDSEINAYKVDRMDRCINYLMSHRRSFSVDMDISARNIVSGQVSSILKLIWLTIVRFRLEAVAEKQLLSIKMEACIPNSVLVVYFIEHTHFKCTNNAILSKGTNFCSLQSAIRYRF